LRCANGTWLGTAVRPEVQLIRPIRIIYLVLDFENGSR
jgi:hypothetical protein